MVYLVTGAAGFIGSALAKRLISGGNKVVTIDNLSTGKIENIPKGCEFIEGNVQDEEIINSLSKYKFDAVFHIAGQSSGEVSFENPVYDFETNAKSTLLLLEFAKQTGINKFIYASSMSTYGDCCNELVVEDDVQKPKSFYAVGKLASENYMRIYSTYGIKCTALRFFNVYGIGQNMDNLKQGMASIYLAMAINDRNIKVKGAKDRFRDFVYIDDVVNACIKAEELCYQDNYNVFNICCKRKITVEYIIEVIKSYISGVKVEYCEGTPGDQFGIYGDNNKANKILNWEPIVTFEEGMDRFIKFAINAKEKK